MTLEGGVGEKRLTVDIPLVETNCFYGFATEKVIIHMGSIRMNGLMMSSCFG